MEHLLLFHQEIDTLNDTEFNQCIQSYGRDNITAILFKAFCHELINKNKSDNVKNMNNIINRIKKERKPNLNNDNDDIEVNEESISMKIDDLPSVLLSEISSYLQFKEQLTFKTKINRSILIHSKSFPFSIHSIPADIFEKFVIFSNQNNNEYLHQIKPFWNAKLLRFNIDEFVLWTEYDDPIDVKYKWNHLHLLNDIKSLEIEYDCGFHVILRHLSECKDLSNINTLRLFGTNHDRSITLDMDDCIELLESLIINHFDLQYFELSEYFENWTYSKPFTFKNSNEWISKLKGIAINNKCKNEKENDMMMDIYSSISNDLESLHKDTSFISNDIDGKLHKLKEICLSWDIHQCDMNILMRQNLNNLERIHFRNVNKDYFENKTMTLWMNKIIGSIKYICFDVIGQQKSILNALRILIESVGNNIHKNRMKVRMNGLSLNDIDYIDEIVIKFEELINILNLKYSNWMILCYSFKILKQENSGNSFDNFLKSMQRKYCVSINDKPAGDGRDDKFYVYNLVISNKNCNISSYSEKWMMECSECVQNNM